MALSANHSTDDWPDPEIPDFDDGGFMVPPWVKYPNLASRSLGWRMGVGEQFMDRFKEWYESHPLVWPAYQLRYPEPEVYSGFYQRRSTIS